MKTKIFETIKGFRWLQWAVVISFIFVLSFTGVHAYRVVHRASYWRHHRDEPIRGWMTVSYVAHSYQVPPHILYQALGLQNKPTDKRPLYQIAKSQNRSMQQIREILADTIEHAKRPDQQPPSPPNNGARL